MHVSRDLDSIFLGSELGGGILYRARSDRSGRTWIRYEVRADGTLVNERIVFDARPDAASWRGLPELDP